MLGISAYVSFTKRPYVFLTALNCSTSPPKFWLTHFICMFSAFDFLGLQAIHHTCTAGAAVFLPTSPNFTWQTSRAHRHSRPLRSINPRLLKVWGPLPSTPFTEYCIDIRPSPFITIGWSSWTTPSSSLGHPISASASTSLTTTSRTASNCATSTTSTTMIYSHLISPSYLGEKGSTFLMFLLREPWYSP